MTELSEDVSPDLRPESLSPLVTIASVPFSHVYVRHISALEPDGVQRLADPDPDAPGRSTVQKWWPPVMLSRDWVRANRFDVFHVQFGFDAWSPSDLQDVVDAVHEQGRSFVYTAHDLRNPHHTTPDLHDAQLAVMMGGADEVITLTVGAAAEIRERWGREARVLPHPHVVDFETMNVYAEDPGPQRDRPFRVGLHLKSLRASMDPLVILPTLVRTVQEMPNAVLQVNGHRDVFLEDGPRADPALTSYLNEGQSRGDLELHVHDFMNDAVLWTYLRSLDLSVLPYRFGTHSGWLEACRDLGTAVAAPTCGHYADQGPVHSFCLDEEKFDETSLERALWQARAAGPVTPLTTDYRRQQRAEIAAAHRELYESLA